MLLRITGRTMYDKATIQILFRFSQIPITIYDLNWNQLMRVPSNLIEPGKYERNIFEKLQTELITNDHCFLPYQEMVPIGIGGCTDGTMYYVLGPVAYGRTDDFMCRQFIKKNSIRECYKSQLESVYSLIEYFIGRKLEDYTGDTVKESLITNEAIRQIDNFDQNHSFMDELTWFEHITNGDYEYMDNQVFSTTTSHPVILDNLMKNEEYITAISISLAARAAISGGVSSSEGFLNNDIFLKRLSECRNVQEVINLKKESQVYFAKLVANNKKKNAMNIYVEKAKKYIETNRFKQVKIEDVAREVGLSKNYLQKLFKSNEGVSISEYISDVKIEAACNMLKYSDRKIRDIAEYLHYGSVSHFSVAFRNKMNISPKEYRDRNRRITFL